MPKHFLTIHHKIYIRGNYTRFSSSKLAIFFGCSKSVVQSYMRKNKIKPSAAIIKKFRKNGNVGKTIFTADMDQVLINDYLSVPQKPLAITIGVSSTCLRHRMKQLGLSIPKDIIQKRKADTRFKKGATPFNKGKNREEYLSPSALRAAQKHQFKKGNKPHNTIKGTGHVRVRKDSKTGRPYKYVKIGDGDWQLLQRVNYEKHYGKIPDNHVIRFKDNNTLNCDDISNLECISQAENGARTINEYHNYPKELKTAIQIKNKLLKTLKNGNN